VGMGLISNTVSLFNGHVMNGFWLFAISSIRVSNGRCLCSSTTWILRKPSTPYIENHCGGCWNYTGHRINTSIYLGHWALYRNTRCCVKTATGVTEMFGILTHRNPAWVYSTFLFLIIIDFIMRKTTHGQDYGIQLGPGKLSDLNFSDDIALLSNTRDTLQDNHWSPEQRHEGWTIYGSVQSRPKQWLLVNIRPYR